MVYPVGRTAARSRILGGPKLNFGRAESLVPFLELTRRFPKGSLRRILSGSERERFAFPKVVVKVTAVSSKILWGSYFHPTCPLTEPW